MFATNSRIFCRKNCAIVALNGHCTVFSARSTAPTCIGAAPSRRRLQCDSSCECQNLRPRRKKCKVCCAVRRNGENFVANSCVIDARFGKVLRMLDRWMRAFSALHAPATRRRNSATPRCVRSDAGRSFGALRVDRAENLQRFRPFSIGKFTQSRP